MDVVSYNELDKNNTKIVGANNPKLNEFVKYVPGIALIIDLTDYRILSANNLFYQHFGYDQKEIEENNISYLSIIDKNYTNVFLNQVDVIKKVKAYSLNYIIYKTLSKNGSPDSFFVYLSYIEGDEFGLGNLVYVLMMPNATNWAIPYWSTETREVFLYQINNTKYGNYEWMYNKNTILCSEGIYSIFEIDDKLYEFTEHGIEKFIHPDDLEKYNSALLSLLHGTPVIDMDIKALTNKNNIRYLHWVCKSYEIETSRDIKIVGSIKDITEQRTTEINLKNKVDELNNTNKELEEFAYVASHDLQEPLRKISTFAGRIAEKCRNSMDEEGNLYLNKTISAAQNMRILINDLLEFSRITKSVLPFVVTDLNSIVRMVKSDLELIIEETQTKIECDKLPAIESIVSQMKQLFINLISNSIKFRKPDTRPIINIRCRLLDLKDKLNINLIQNIDFYSIEISDNGIGFEEKYAATIFQVFQRLHGKSEYPGSGIGLAICKKIAEYHNGKIFANSPEGNGAIFTIVLPANQMDFKQKDS